MRTLTRPFALTAACLTILVSAQAAHAQYNYNYSSNIWVNSGMNLLFQKRWETARMRAAGKNELADAMEGRRAGGAQAAAQNAPAENPLLRAPLSATAFRPTPSRVMPPILAAALADQKGEDFKVLSRVFGELLDNYDGMLAANGETRLKNNVAGAAAFALIMSRSVLTDGKSDLGERQSEALLQEINALLASSDDFKNLDAVKKQKMYETFVITAGLSAMLYQEGVRDGNAETAAKGKELARTILSQFFDRPLEEVRFTEEGVGFGN